MIFSSHSPTSPKEFRDLQNLVTELNSTNSTNAKKEILLKHKSNQFIKAVLYYTYNPFMQYYVTPENLDKLYNDNLGAVKHYDDLFSLLQALYQRDITGHLAINSVNDFVYRYEPYKDLIYKIIGKDLEIRMGDTLINKVIPNLIPTFDVALATDIEDVPVDFDHPYEWYASRKLDGVRCLAMIDNNGEVNLRSRQGNEFETLDKIKDEIKSLGLTNAVLDGEICLMDANGNEDFQGIMKQIRRKNHTIANPKYIIFDLLTLNEFLDKKAASKYVERYTVLQNLIPKSKHLSVIQQTRILGNTHFNSLMGEADAKGWEGLILRKNVGYEGKRSKNMLKCKSFKDAEYEVIDIEVGPFRMIENGLEVTKEVLSNVIIEHKGNQVSVGSGFSIEEREYFKNNPSEILNKTITVKYFQETQNQSGNWSLRFPTVKCIHGFKRTV